MPQKRDILSDASPDIKYQGNWSRQILHNSYKSITGTMDIGATATVNSTYSVDGTDVKSHISTPSGNSSDKLFFSIGGQKDQKHTLLITNYGQSLWLNYFNIEGDVVNALSLTTFSTPSTSTQEMSVARASAMITSTTLLSRITTSTVVVPSSAQASVVSSTDPSSHIATIAGAIVGTCMFLIVLVIGIVWLYLYRRRKATPITVIVYDRESDADTITAATDGSFRASSPCPLSLRHNSVSCISLTSTAYPTILPCGGSDPEPEVPIDVVSSDSDILRSPGVNKPTSPRDSSQGLPHGERRE
ncbi:hypothetical protein C8Q76DRAFT_859605 [Earliella scabrosa]|nr:hypothetical protein C8Q76DRAFT_859605 [Earliella scabrosa]